MIGKNLRISKRKWKQSVKCLEGKSVFIMQYFIRFLSFVNKVIVYSIYLYKRLIIKVSVTSTEYQVGAPLSSARGSWSLRAPPLCVGFPGGAGDYPLTPPCWACCTSTIHASEGAESAEEKWRPNKMSVPDWSRCISALDPVSPSGSSLHSHTPQQRSFDGMNWQPLLTLWTRAAEHG